MASRPCYGWKLQKAGTFGDATAERCDAGCAHGSTVSVARGGYSL